jgi:hypothetical protein
MTISTIAISPTSLDARPAAGDARRAPDQLRIVPWIDPVVDAAGHDPRSWYVETFWLGVLGPSTVWLLRLLAAGFDEAPSGFDLDLDDTARALGIGGRRGRNAPFQRTLDRCVTFDMARPAGPATLAVRRHLPPLARRHLLRLPPTLQERHRSWVDSRLRVPPVEVLRQRSRRLALSLVELGEDQRQVETALARWRFHPALAHEAACWAVSRIATGATGARTAAGAAGATGATGARTAAGATGAEAAEGTTGAAGAATAEVHGEESQTVR